MNDWQWVINIAAGAALSAMGWFARILWEAVQELKKDLANLRVEIAKDYTPKNDFQSAMSELRGMFQIIRDKLDDKADK
jgi:hypothetical protein